MKRIAIVKWTPIDISIISLSLIEMLTSITIISQLPYFSMFSNVVNVINYLLLLTVISKKKYSPRLFLIFGVFALILLYGYIQSGMSAFLTAWFLIFAVKDYDFKKIIADIHFSISIILILALIFGMFYLSDINNQLRSGFYLGMGHKNTLGCYLFEYYLTGIYSKKFNRHFVLMTEFTAILVFIITRCKTAAGLLFVFPIILLLVQKMIHTKCSNVVTLLIEMIAPVLTIFTYVTAKLFPISSYVQTLNRFMTNRIFLNWFILSKNRITLFGQNVQLHYTGIHNEIINQWNISTTVDGTYIVMLLLLGLIPTIIFLIGYIALVHKGGGTQRLHSSHNSVTTFNLCIDGDKVYQYIF